MADLGQQRPLYSISVTSELTGVNQQMLRQYESKGLLAPYRTDGGTRIYSPRDVDRIDEITSLLSAGLNLAGIAQVLLLQEEAKRLRREIARLKQRAATNN